MNNADINKDKVREIVNLSPCHFMFVLKKQYDDIYDYIDNKFNGKTFSEKIYKFLNNDINVGKCIVCDKDCKFINIKKGYSKTCSYKCNSLYKSKNSKETRRCVICDDEFETYKKRNKSTCSKDCLILLNKSDEVNNKRVNSLKKTCIEKYGVDSYSKTDEFLSKVKQTKLSKYGDENYVNVDKIKKTCLNKYGVDSYNKTEEFKKKYKKTCLKKYGVDNFNKTKQFKFIHFLKTISKLNNVKPLFNFDDYTGVSNKKYNFLCKTCNNNFIDTIDNGRIPICRKCFPVTRTGAQNEIVSFIKTLLPNSIIEESTRKIIPPYELDIYIDDKKLAIEYNGLFWHGERNNKDKKYHLNKTNECLSKGIRLIHIFEDEWINKKEIVKNRLKHIICPSKSIYARDCIIKDINSKLCNDFLNKFHLQGEDKSKIKIGLFYKNELISVMTFNGYRYATGNKLSVNKKYEMVRFCIGNIGVIGAAGKMLTYFIKKYNPDKIITYADRRWSFDKAFYGKIGFKYVSNTPPNYYYIKKHNNIRYNRLQFQKHKLKNKLEKFDNNLTEWQNMQLNEYDRIWDCGNLKYEWNK